MKLCFVFSNGFGLVSRVLHKSQNLDYEQNCEMHNQKWWEQFLDAYRQLIPNGYALLDVDKYLTLRWSLAIAELSG